MKKIVLFAMIVALFSSLVFAESVTIKWGDGQTVTVDLPEELVDLVADNMDLIVDALEENNVTQTDVEEVINSEEFKEVEKFYDDFKSEHPDMSGPISTVKDSLEEFNRYFGPTIANDQFMQSVWAEAWAGQFLPKGFHIGGGVNAGIAQLKLYPITDAFKAFAGDIDLKSSLFFPTIAGDIRIGGIYFPFDVGFSLMTLDSSKIGALKDMPFSAKYFTIGIDGRWALMKGEGPQPKISVGGGFAYTKGEVGVKEKEISADIGFSTLNFYAQGQISKKLLFFIPFAGLKLGFTNSKLSWSFSPDWNTLFPELNKNTISTPNGELTLADLNILPPKIGDDYSKFRFVPQIYGGFGLDFFVVNLTFTGGYDIVNRIWSAGVNLRIAW